jgi:hypothetical protein
MTILTLNEFFGLEMFEEMRSMHADMREEFELLRSEIQHGLHRLSTGKYVPPPHEDEKYEKKPKMCCGQCKKGFHEACGRDEFEGRWWNWVRSLACECIFHDLLLTQIDGIDRARDIVFVLHRAVHSCVCPPRRQPNLQRIPRSDCFRALDETASHLLLPLCRRSSCKLLPAQEGEREAQEL